MRRDVPGVRRGVPAHGHGDVGVRPPPPASPPEGTTQGSVNTKVMVGIVQEVSFWPAAATDVVAVATSDCQEASLCNLTGGSLAPFP